MKDKKKKYTKKYYTGGRVDMSKGGRVRYAKGDVVKDGLATREQETSKRKVKSNWSKINKDKVEILIAQGLMKEAGFKSIETAKKNGSWTILDEVEALVIPQDLNDEFKNHKGSFEYYESLSNSAKKILLYWVVSAKRQETRQKRILEIAENASNNTKPKQFR